MLFIKEADNFGHIVVLLNNLYISHRSLYAPTYSFWAIDSILTSLPGLIPFAILWHAGWTLEKPFAWTWTTIILLQYLEAFWPSYMWLVTRKGTSWVSYSEIHFFRFLNREFYDESRNISMLVGSWSIWVSKCPQKMGTSLKRHKLSIDVIVTLHVHHKIQQINSFIRYCKMTLQCICCYQFPFLFFYLLFLSFFLLYFFFKCRTGYFSSLQLHYWVKT